MSERHFGIDNRFKEGDRTMNKKCPLCNRSMGDWIKLKDIEIRFCVAIRCDYKEIKEREQ